MEDLELERDDTGVDEGVSEETSPTSTAGKPARQPASPPPNWDDDPKFREWKSNSQRAIAAAERTANEARQHAASLQRELERQQMAGLDDTQQAMYRAQLAERRAQEAEQKLEMQMQYTQWQRAIADIAAETGAPIDKLDEARDIHEAWKIANRISRDQSTRKAERVARQEDEERAANAVDVGGGSVPSAVESLRRRYLKARDVDRDPGDMFDISEEAARKGIATDDW